MVDICPCCQYSWCCAPKLAEHQDLDGNTVALLHVGKVEQWSSLFQVLLATAHHQLDALYFGLQNSQEAMNYR